MSIMQIVLLALVGAVASILLKKTAPEIAMLVGIATGTIILYFAIGLAKDIISTVTMTAETFNIDLQYIKLVIKIIGITYLSEFVISSLNDAGESGIASKVEMFTKIFIVSMSLPVFSALIQTISSVLI